ncbi:hypothetical protein FPQ18DRAFT_303775 [Pyronema domesticum]|nr:hypothetical protein FPQ18DRAFT_303775 [Pyronema domesticum]
MASNSSLDEIEKDECEVDDEDEEGEEGVSTERVEEVRRLLDINQDDWDLYGGWAWGEVRWTVAPQSSSKKLQWQIDSTVLEGTQIQQKIEQHCRGKLSLTPSFILTVLVNKYRNYGRQITAPQYVKDQTATVMWDLMKIDMANTLSKTAVKNAAKKDDRTKE